LGLVYVYQCGAMIPYPNHATLAEIKHWIDLFMRDGELELLYAYLRAVKRDSSQLVYATIMHLRRHLIPFYISTCQEKTVYWIEYMIRVLDGRD